MRPTGSQVSGATPNRIPRHPLAASRVMSQSQQARLLALRRVQGWFADGARGGLWLPEDGALFQDSTAITAAAVGSPVGYVLDQSREPPLGRELVTDGGFDNAAAWTLGSVSVSGGVASGTSSNGWVYQTIASAQTALYRVELDVVRSAGTLTVTIGSAQTAPYVISTSGHHSFIIPATQTTQWFYIATAGFTGTIDNASVRAIGSFGALQATTAYKPTLRRAANSRRLYSDCLPAGVALTATFSPSSSLGANCSLFRASPSGMVKLEGQSIGTTLNLCTQNVLWAGTAVINRATSPAEDALLAELFSYYTPAAWEVA